MGAPVARGSGGFCASPGRGARVPPERRASTAPKRYLRGGACSLVPQRFGRGHPCPPKPIPTRRQPPLDTFIRGAESLPLGLGKPEELLTFFHFPKPRWRQAGHVLDVPAHTCKAAVRSARVLCLGVLRLRLQRISWLLGCRFSDLVQELARRFLGPQGGCWGSTLSFTQRLLVV